MIGRTLAQYRVEEQLGKGGMGAVYRAFDTRLKRGEARRTEQVVGRALADLQSLSHSHHTRHYLAAALATIEQPERALEQLRLAAKTGLPNYPLFLGDRHFESLRLRADGARFLAELKPAWEAYRREFGD